MKKKDMTIEDLAELISGVATSVDSLAMMTQREFLAMGKRMDKFELRMDKLEKRMDKLEKRMDKLELRVGRLEESISEMKSEIIDIKHELSKTTDYQDYLKLEARIVKLEKAVLMKN